MTPTERNESICQMYLTGSTPQECSEKYGVGVERVRQILRDAGIKLRWGRQSEYSGRESYIGVNVKPEAKNKLKAKAKKKGVSMSRLVSDHIDDLLK